MEVFLIIALISFALLQIMKAIEAHAKIRQIFYKMFFWIWTVFLSIFILPIIRFISDLVSDIINDLTMKEPLSLQYPNLLIAGLIIGTYLAWKNGVFDEKY